jgi:hypothetical protein
MINYLTTVPKREAIVVSGARAEDDSGLVVVGVKNFEGDTFSFPQSDESSGASYVTVLDSERRIIRFSILQS